MAPIRLSLAFAALMASLAPAAAAPLPDAVWETCNRRPASEIPNCVISADTIRLGRSNRLATVDSPDLNGPQCDAERALAATAAEAMGALLREGGWEVVPTGETDSDGRPFIRLERQGVEIGELLIEAGVARPIDDPMQGWC